MLKKIKIVALVSFFEGLATTVWLASIPASGGRFSPVRLASLTAILLITLGCLIIFIYTKSDNKITGKFVSLVEGKSALLISLLLTTIALTTWVTILYKDWLLIIINEAIYTRLLPIAVLGILLCIQLGILFLIPNISKEAWLNCFHPIWKTTIILIVFFLSLGIFMSVTGLGFTFDNVGLSWGPPGTPITFAQVNLVFAISLILTFIYSILKHRIRLQWTLPFKKDIVIFIGLWGLAVFLWWNEPVSSTHFNPPPMAPNYEIYPNSDALIFDKSSYHLLFGTGFSNQLIRRPLYVGMLALFHKMGGYSYESTTLLQIIFLAFIPPLTYLLTSNLSNRLAGLLAGGLILLREKNAIELSDKIVTSNAKLLMSDMVAMLGVIALIYIMIKALSRKNHNIWLLGIAGACLGLTALVRAQVLILLPLLVLFVFMEQKPIKYRGKDAFMIILGLILVLSPWIWRNWNLTGTIVLDDQGEEKLLARNYSANPVAFPPILPGESEKEYSSRIKQDILIYIIENPADVAFFISNHFLRSMATSAVYIAPLYSNASPHELVDQTQFWNEWDGMLTGYSPISLFTNIVILAFGISIAQKKNTLAGWLIFASMLLYTAGNALVRTSGWRFSLPVDWIILIYYSIALAYIPSRIEFLPEGKKSIQVENRYSFQKQRPEIIIFCLLLLAGALVPIAEKLIPNNDFSRLTNKAKEKITFENIISQADLETFLAQENAVFYSGKALYPRYITRNSRIYLAYIPRDFNLLHFWLINDGDHQIVLPLQESPDYFPHVSNVSVIGCQEDNYIFAWAVIVHSPVNNIIIQDQQAPLSCPINMLN